MEHKEIGTNVEGSTSVTDGSTKIAFRTKSYNAEAHSLAKVDATTSRPCAIIGPDRVLPPNSNDMYLKKTLGESWISSDNMYRHPPEYPNKISDYQPTRNISPRQTFQENMQRIMVPPSFSSMKSSNESSLQNIKPNMPQEAKYCDVPYSVNSVTNEHKSVRNPDIPMPNVNPAFTRNIPPPYGWSSSVNVRHLRPYGAPEYQQYTEFPSCAGPRPMSMIRPHRSLHEDSAQAFSERLYQDANIRFKPYPTAKEQLQQTRYDYINNYPNTFHPPAPYPPHKYDIQKTMHGHPYSIYPQVPLKYLDRRVHDPFIEGYHRSPNQQINFNTFHSQIVPPPYGPIPGNCVQSKSYSEIPSKHMTINKMQFESNNKVYLNLDSSRTKSYPVPDNYFYNDVNQPLRGEILLPPHPASNVHSTPQHLNYRKDNTALKSYEYNPHYKSFEHSVNLNHPLSKVPLQFSPNTIAISPSDSNTSNDTVHTLGTIQDDCGYVSQSSTASARSLDSINMPIAHDIYRRHNYNNYGIVRNTFHMNGSEQNSKHKMNSLNKKSLNVRQFLQMWNEGDDEVNESNKEVTAQNHTYKYPNQSECAKNQEQLYVLGLVNVPNEELDKYNHIQKISKLPENIKGYDNIEILNQYEQLLETPHSSNYNKQIAPRDNRSFSKTMADRESTPRIPRPISPLDVEAKISQSVIHKEVGCNFEIKPCSPEMLSVEVAAPVQTLLNERMIEKVLNPIVSNAPISSQDVNNTAHTESSINNSNKIASCKLISSQYIPDNSIDKLKTSNYTIQDLESSSGICLASLPQLDNDIELNFPEINQQFIKANKIKSVNTPILLDLPKLNIEQSNQNLSQEIESNFEARPPSQAHLYCTSDKEFSKLSKYRKNKKFEPIDKQDTLKSNEFSTLQRINSVIIKNPDNIKLQDTENVTISCNKTQEVEHHSRYDNNVLSPATAIDFSLNRSDSETEDVRKNSQKSILTKNIKEKLDDTKPEIISSFLSNNKDLLIECSSSPSTDDNQLHKSSENQYDRIDVQTNTSTVNIFSEKHNVHVITKVVSNLETSTDNEIVQDNINNTEIATSASHNAMSKQLCQKLNDPINSAKINIEETINPACIDVDNVENFQLQSNDTEVFEGNNNSKLCCESKDGWDLTDTGNVCEIDSVVKTSFNNSEILSLKTDEKKSINDSHKKETTDMELATEQNVKHDINIDKPNKSTDNTINVIQVNNDIEENDIYERSIALVISDNKNENNITDILNTKYIQNSLNDPKIEESEIFSESFKTPNIDNLCFKNLQNLTDVHEKDVNTCKIRLKEKNDTIFSTSTCDSSKLEAHYSSKNVLEIRKAKDFDLPDLEDEVKINKDEEKYISQKCDFNFEISIQNDKSLGISTIIRPSFAQEENVVTAKAFHQMKTHECVTSKLECLSEKNNIHNKNEVCLPLLNNIVPLKENSQNFKTNSIEINGEMPEFSILSDKSYKDTASLKNEICLSSIQELDLKHTPSPELEESKYKLVSNSNNMNTNNSPQVSFNEDEISANDDSTVTKSVMTENLEPYQCYSELFENKEKCILKTHNVHIKKELFSPWVQKLLTFTEGPYTTNILKSTEENITEHREKNCIYENLGSNEEVKENNKKKTELQNSEIENNSPNSKFESNVFNHTNSLNEINNSIIFTPFMDCSEMTISEQGSDCFQQDDICDKGDTNYKLDTVHNKTISKPHRILKRSLSESALEEYKHNDDTKTLQPCKRKRLNQTILQSHVIPEDICNIIQTNRRNSISTFYNEENVYIVIDNDLILTDEENSEKLCYTQMTDDYSTNIESTEINEVNLNLETVFSDESTTIEFSDKIQNEEQPLDESWVEDIACMETVFSEDVAENIVIDTQASPKKNDDLETEDDAKQAYYDSEHINKIRNIYGSTMCNDDTQLIETLYKTPQMDVNKTLHYIESHSPEEFLENSCNDTYINSNHQNAELGKSSSFSDIDKENMSKNSNFLFDKSQEDYYLKNHEKSDIQLTISPFQIEHHKACISSNENLISNVKDDIPNYSCSSSPEVSSTTSEEKNSSILLKITNCNGSIVSEVNEISSDKINKISYKLTEKGEYQNYNTNFRSSRTLITKAAQKYIPPLKDLKVKLHLSQHRLNTLKQLKLLKSDSKLNSSILNFSNKNLKPDIFKKQKQKPKFEDVLKSIDEINFKKRKHQTKRGKSAIPKVVIKKNENGAHYASNKTANRNGPYNPDLTGRKWQPWVFIEKNSFIDGMALNNKVKAIYCHRKNSYVLADKFRKYKSVYNANFVISQPNTDCSSKGNLKYTIRLKQN